MKSQNKLELNRRQKSVKTIL